MFSWSDGRARGAAFQHADRIINHLTGMGLTCLLSELQEAA